MADQNAKARMEMFKFQTKFDEVYFGTHEYWGNAILVEQKSILVFPAYYQVGGTEF